MREPLFTGICTALVTPFQNNTVNYTMLKKLIQRQLDAGIHALVLCGTTGEAPTLSDSEKLTIFSKAKSYIGNNGLLIAGTGSNDTSHAVSLSQKAQACGADALLVVTPYYNKATQEGLYAHFSAVAKSVTIPVIVYNVPSRTGVDTSVEVYKELAKIPNIAGVKEASNSISKISKIMAACPDSFSVWSGNDDMTIPVMALGGQGVISVASNVIPANLQRMVKAWLSGNCRSAGAMQISLLPLIEQLFCETNPIPVKEAMRIIGFECGSCRLPLTPPSDAHSTALKHAINSVLATKDNIP